MDHTNHIKKILDGYGPITLNEMDNVQLMNRTDTKFVFHIDHLASILETVQPHYASLEVSGTRMSKYETLYYDTDDFELYARHHCGKMNRYKIRSRRYVESDLHFFEVKYKNNKGRTIKNRVRTQTIEEILSQNSRMFLAERSNIDPNELRAKIWINYSRITLVNRLGAERLTIDVGLHFIAEQKRCNMSSLVIAEVKQDNANSISPILEVMRKKRIREGSISKYCLGIVSMYDHVRKNNFKENIRRINKLTYAA